MSQKVPECVWPVGAELGEGPIWMAEEHAVYFVDIKGRKLHRWSEKNGQRQSWDAPDQIGFIAPLEQGGFMCGVRGGLMHFNTDTGQFSLYKEVERPIPTNRLNDGFVDYRGRLWFGSMDDGQKAATGSLYRIDHQAGEILRQDPGYVITNGPAMSPDGRTLYHTDTLGHVVYVFDAAADGMLSNKREFARITAGGHPDGMAVDADGFVWIAVFRGWRIDRYSPQGEIVETISFPCSNITKLAFGGDDLRTAYVTTAWKELSAEERVQQPLAGALFSFRVETPGLQQYRFSKGNAQ